MKQSYKSPAVKVVEFRAECGYAISALAITHEVFFEDNSGNESYQDEPADDLDSYDWSIF